MTDRERALAELDKVARWKTLLGLKEAIADVVLRFAANEVETCVGDPTFRAEELRAQVGRKVADPDDCAYVFDSGRKR